mmetsp:Transcript_10386/g.12158  ORF Transcript_10386/g.12158 Transcript_10386/m.12158 type:complete len:712 (+) Transcript_10386:244-2379(+)
MAKGKSPSKGPAKGAAPTEGSDKEAEFEMLMTSKNLELAECKAKAERLMDELFTMRENNSQLNDTLSGVKKDASDILAHLERDMLEKRGTVAVLSERVEGLTTELDNTRLRIQELEKEREEASAEISAATRSIEEKHELEGLVSELRSTISTQNKHLTANENTITSLEQQVKSTQRTLDDLRLELSRSTTTVHVAGYQWTLKRSKHRLTGVAGDENNIPSVRERNSLSAVGRMAILFGGTLKGGLCSNDTFVLNTENLQWEKYAGQGEVPCARGGHSVILNNKKRLLVFGGRRNPLMNDLYALNPDTMKWVSIKAKDAQANLPESVEKAGLCITGDQVLLLGGDTTQRHGEVSSAAKIPVNGWLLNIEGGEAEWTPTEFTGVVPQRCNFSVTESPDGRYIFTFGGSDANGVCTNQLHILNVDRLEWSNPEMVMGAKPAPREGHCAAMFGRFLVISGGWNENGRLGDTHVLDTEAMCWEALDTQHVQNQMHGDDRLRARTVVITNDVRIIMLGSSGGNVLDEVDIMDITIPDEAFQNNVYVRSDMILVEAIQDENDMRQIRLTWRPPANIKARVSQYKVMMSLGGSAMVKEMYRGVEESCRITGAKAGNSYQFRVKGEYSDGSYIWSDICEIYMRQAGTEIFIPKQTIPLKGRKSPPAVKLRGSPSLSRMSQSITNPNGASPGPKGNVSPVPLTPGTVGYAANMVKGRGPFY